MCVHAHVCTSISVQWDSPSCPRVVVKFIFLSIVSCWDIKGPLFVDQRGCCRLLAGPGQERLHLSSTSFLSLISFLPITELLSMLDLPQQIPQTHTGSVSPGKKKEKLFRFWKIKCGYVSFVSFGPWRGPTLMTHTHTHFPSAQRGSLLQNML